MFSTMFILVAVAVLAVVALAVFIFSRYRVTKPDEAFIVTGRKDAEGAGQKVIVSGSTFVMPVIEQLHSISLASVPLTIDTEALDSDNIPLNIRAVAAVKVGGTEKDVQLASQRFLHAQGTIAQYADGIVSGVLRAVVGEMVTKDVIGNREVLNQRVMAAAMDALSVQGLVLDSLQIQSITDNNGYIEALGAPKAAEVRRDAARAKSLSDQQAQEAQLAADQVVAEKTRDLEIRKQEFRQETEAASAKASAAGPTQQAIADKAIAEQETLTAQEKARLTEARLLAEVKAPAEAEATRVRIAAEAQKASIVANAEAKAQAIAIEAEAEAKRIEMTGAAEAKAIEAKAEATKKLTGAARDQMVLELLPAIVREIAEPMSNIEGMTIISTDGASTLTKQMGGTLGQVAGLFDGLGIDLGGLLGRKDEETPVVVRRESADGQDA